MKTGGNFTFLYCLMLLCQIVLCNFSPFGPYIVLTMLPAMIFCMPLSISTISCMFIAFGSGLAVDWLSEGLIGINAASLVPVALARKSIVKMFFGDEPEMPMCYEPKQMDLAIMPCIDGWFKTEVKPMGQFEASYQSYHSMMNFFGLNQLLCGVNGLAMPIVDTDERRQDRAAFCAKYAAGRPYFMIRAKSPQLVFDEIDKLMAELGLN